MNAFASPVSWSQTLILKPLSLLFFLAMAENIFCRDLPDSGILSINPDYKLERKSNGEVIIYAKDAKNTNRFSFRDFNADLLLAAYHRQNLDYVIRTFAKKYYLSDDDCRREIKHALNVLTEWNIVLLEKRP